MLSTVLGILLENCFCVNFPNRILSKSINCSTKFFQFISLNLIQHCFILFPCVTVMLLPLSTTKITVPKANWLYTKCKRRNRKPTQYPLVIKFPGTVAQFWWPNTGYQGPGYIDIISTSTFNLVFESLALTVYPWRVVCDREWGLAEGGRCGLSVIWCVYLTSELAEVELGGSFWPLSA